MFFCLADMGSFLLGLSKLSATKQRKDSTKIKTVVVIAEQQCPSLDAL